MKLIRIMIIFLVVIATFILLVTLYMRQEKFGQIPKGERMERIKNSPYFIEGVFKNINHTPQMTNENGFWQMTKEYFSAKNKKPKNEIPTVKTELHTLPVDENVLVWFGHSSYFLQIDGKKILVDPVFSGHASPFTFSVKAFKGSDNYLIEDIPELDFLVITHDHWDHLDYKTVLGLKDKIQIVVTGLGVGSHFERWGFSANSIVELDWNEKMGFKDEIVFHATPARHFSGRGFIHKKTLWTSFVLETLSTKIFIGGDSGYDTHFAEIGKKFENIDLAILENGQYNHSWKYIHMHPNDVLQAAKDLNAKTLFPVHSMKFALANHAWETPLRTITELNKKEGKRMITPLIGDVVNLNDSTQEFPNWWEEVK